MEIIIGMQNMTIDGYQPINDDIDGAFKSFYTSCFSDPDIGNEDGFGRILTKYLPQLDEAFNKFAAESKNEYKLHDMYFTNLTGLWKHILNNGGIGFAQAFWRRSLFPVWQWEEKSGSRIHKGTPFT